MPDRPHHTDKWHRCVEEVMAKGHDESSASAICTTSLQDAGEEIYNAESARHLHLLGSTSKARTEMVDGREHLVVPVVALMEGVIHAVNAETPELVRVDVLRRAASTWNDKPACVGHPKNSDGKQCSASGKAAQAAHGIGTIRSAVMKGAKLFMETLVDPLRLKSLKHDALLADLQDGKPVEVSVGAFVATNSKASKWTDGKPYIGEWLEVIGDHIAFLPGGRGACSLDMGCGAHRAAMRVCEESLELVDPVDDLLDAAKRYLDAMKMIPCEMCDGTGQVKKDGKQMDCPMCDGSGEMRAASLKTLLGSRHSQNDMKMIQQVHDHSVSLGAECDRKNYKTASAPEFRAATIRHEGGKWVLYTKDGSRRLGSHDTEADAKAQEQAIEAAKHRRSAQLASSGDTAAIQKPPCSCGGTT